MMLEFATLSDLIVVTRSRDVPATTTTTTLCAASGEIRDSDGTKVLEENKNSKMKNSVFNRLSPSLPDTQHFLFLSLSCIFAQQVFLSS